jgi:GNAT superfamily N-acetyltransferase
VRVFREATTADVPALVALVNLAYRVEDAFCVGDRCDAAELASLLETGRFLVTPALDACVYVEPRADGAVYLGLLSVHPSRQGAGLGVALMAAAEGWARARGATRMELTVIDLREEALHAWYAKRGYRFAGEAPVPVSKTSRFTRPVRFLRMTKALAQNQ